VRNTCIVYSQSNKEIIAYCELHEPLTIQTFRAILAEVLPTYMLPKRLVEVNEMPMNPNGKIDRLYFKQLLKESRQ